MTRSTTTAACLCGHGMDRHAGEAHALECRDCWHCKFYSAEQQIKVARLTVIIELHDGGRIVHDFPNGTDGAVSIETRHEDEDMRLRSDVRPPPPYVTFGFRPNRGDPGTGYCTVEVSPAADS